MRPIRFLSKNVVSGALILGFAGIAYFGLTSIYFVICLSAIFFSLIEFYVLTLGRYYFVAAVAGLIVPIGMMGGGVHVAQMGFGILMIFALSAILFIRNRPGEARFDEIMKVVFGWSYISWMLGHSVLLPNLENGWKIIGFVFSATVLRNISAGMLGRLVPGRPITDANPRKTIEGAMIGLAVTVAAMLLVHPWLFHPIALRDVLLVSVLICVVGQFGDLFESFVKRVSGVEESSRMLAGQGGVLDTVDSFVFTIPATFYYFSVLQEAIP